MREFHQVVAEEWKYFLSINDTSLDWQNCLNIVCSNQAVLRAKLEDQGAKKAVCHNGSDDAWHRMT